jgi:hypothetical protein
MSYYRAALRAAAEHNLTVAERYALAATKFEPGNMNAMQLLELCRTELFGAVRECNIAGCKQAAKHRYRAASKQFQAALALDCGNVFAQRALAEIAGRRSLF